MRICIGSVTDLYPHINSKPSLHVAIIQLTVRFMIARNPMKPPRAHRNYKIKAFQETKTMTFNRVASST